MTAGTRAVSALNEPGDLTGYPACEARARYRAHPKGYGPWWFASNPANPEAGGRFDLPKPKGTCYVASSPWVAARESLGPEVTNGWITDSPKWQNLQVSTIEPADRPDPTRKIANSKVQAAANFHTGELPTDTPYDLPRRWAGALCAHGFGGIRYRARFSTGDRNVAEAWFGPAGAPFPAPGHVTVPRGEWERKVGLRVVPATLKSGAIKPRH